MSDDLSVDTEAVQAFAAENAGISTQLAAAGNFDAVGQVAALTPVFGLIGGDYLLSFAAAQVLQAKDINDLSAKFNNLSSKAFTAAFRFEDTDQGNAGEINANGAEI
ncbi:type VII secretion target [Nocardia bovistercoris]|uniref:ESX-1 secretion-associated protein n=1 Tax=Nocardia bovistercoris TaxID=2785916 RepID=A0A931N1H3_9NOCA|nr:type VII secretion target [Nocardia bovistercoris]MBH0774936.1 ESX-1 secretion-associated protein [Nocardia bovistercoris]